MKVTIDGPEELFPVYDFSLEDGSAVDAIEVAAETVQRWRTAFDTFNEAQEEMRALRAQMDAAAVPERKRLRAAELRREAEKLEEEAAGTGSP